MILRWQSVPRLLQCLKLGHCSPLGLLYQSEYGYVGTPLPAHVGLVRADYRLLPLSLVWHGTQTHHVCSDFRVFHVREGSLCAAATPFG